jgi:hypothetical protein
MRIHLVNNYNIFCVYFDVMYSGEYNVSDVTLSLYSHRANLSTCPTLRVTLENYNMAKLYRCRYDIL